MILIDGQKFVELLYEHDLGVKKQKIFEYKEIDDDFLMIQSLFLILKK